MHKRCSTFLPATNDQVEQYVQYLKQTIKAVSFEEGSMKVKL